MNSFYLTLPSNTDENGKTGNFRVHLPEKIDLEGNWEVALVELLYPYSWNNVHNNKEDYDFNQNTIGLLLNGVAHYTTIEPGYYETIRELQDAIEQAMINLMRKIRFSDEEFNQKFVVDENQFGEFEVIKLKFDYIKKKMTLEINTHYVHALMLSKHLAYVLGFKEQVLTKDHVAEHAMDLRGGTDALYVYCNVVTNQVVGNTRVPLLRICPIQGIHGNIIEKTFYSPHYIPVLCREVDHIEIAIKSDTGTLIPFEYGKTVTKLHFRKTRNLVL